MKASKNAGVIHTNFQFSGLCSLHRYLVLILLKVISVLVISYLIAIQVSLQGPLDWWWFILFNVCVICSSDSISTPLVSCGKGNRFAYWSWYESDACNTGINSFWRFTKMSLFLYISHVTFFFSYSFFWTLANSRSYFT